MGGGVAALLLAGDLVADFAREHTLLLLGAVSVGLAAAILLTALVAQALVNVVKKVQYKRRNK